MTGRKITLSRSREVWLTEAGSGPPLVYLHGIADVHGAAFDLLDFHHALAEGAHLIAPAHPGCADSVEDESIETIDDLVFHYMEVLDALNLSTFALAGCCIGGWVAAEIAVRHPERVQRLCLIGATGLFVSGAPIADVFWETHATDGVSLAPLRQLLFSNGECEAARAMFPDMRGEIHQELLRYKLFRFASRIGFNPPYFYNRNLVRRLARYRGPALAIWGADDRMVPRSHAEAFAAGLGDARLEILAGGGHSIQVARAGDVAALAVPFLSQ